MSHKTTQKRFVAGARCPECKEMDTIVCYYEDDVFVRECVECDFSETISNEDESAAKQQIISIKEL